ncbi:MAG TPA: ABC transporter ATP-binding protein [Candidatus Baltobacteraceae bacterium]
MTAPVLARDVRKAYATSSGDAIALAGVSLELRRGEMVALVGPSGCGKTTLLNLIGCVDLPTSGEILIEGRRTTDLSDDELTLLRRDRIGTIFQFFNLLPALTVEQNVSLPLVLRGAAKDEVSTRVRETLGLVGIVERARAFPAELSGGQQQRVAVARAIVHRPAIVLADEPTGNLDSKNGAIVLDLLRTIANGGQTVLMATHNESAAAISDRTLHMQDGQWVYSYAG